MTQVRCRATALLVGVLTLSCVRATRAAESCNQVAITPGTEATVSVLLPDVASGLQTRLQVRDARASKPVDPWGGCPTTQPYGTCSPATHADASTVATSKIYDPGDGMQLIGYRMKNAAAAMTRDPRLCVQYTTQ
ncbi:MAG TPA: hypothetical protein VMS22_22255 [Candidatus Eisenbacteria bacterium]|nr:hypothetical protein [Candidatus Eisenbacteria bacterium]